MFNFYKISRKEKKLAMAAIASFFLEWLFIEWLPNFRQKIGISVKVGKKSKF